MSDEPLAISFVDRERGVYAAARSDFTLVFSGGSASSFDEPLELNARDGGWSAKLPGDLDLELTRVAAPVELGGMRANLCSAGGDALAVVAEIRDAPRWQELDATRFITVLANPENAVVAFARRPQGARGHGEELVVAHLWSDGELKSVEDARISTIYDGEGRPRRSSLELWLPGEDFPRRAFGTVTAGASLSLEGLDVHAAAMAWRLEGHDAAGVYELTVREPAPAAA
jgi:hypothetical protein